MCFACSSSYVLPPAGCGEHFQSYSGHPRGDSEAAGAHRGHSGDDRRGKPSPAGGPLL